MLNRSIVFVFLFLCACNGPEERSAHRYMDLKGFFQNEARRLNKLGIKINKTVSRNGVSESRSIIIPDWESELSLFTESDINKPAWNNSYRISENNAEITYTALDSKLRTRSVSIKKDKQGKPEKISIINNTRNNLYNSSEELSYTPGTSYKIIKKQDVIFLEDNEYEIIGVFAASLRSQ